MKRIAVISGLAGTDRAALQNCDGYTPKGPKKIVYTCPAQLVQFLEEIPGTQSRLWCDVETGIVYHIEPTEEQ